MFTLENWIGLPGILYGGGALFLLLGILPFVDRNPNRYWKRRPVAMTLGLLVLLAVVALTILMWTTQAKTHLGM
jgi:quinol-cytochrome oxidoreductase complex cytochrome b subunit